MYNLHGRRDNLNKARIKILVNQLGIDKFREDVEADWEQTRKDAIDLPEDERRRIMSYFAPPDLSPRPIRDEAVDQRRITDPVFANWLKHNVHLAERAWPHAGRRQLGPDGFRCRSRRAL